ncbi:uncharacterized protein SETTUDRAFT_162213 [Exserohilum turcica Et28A]|uniref:Uncharacterized protein n=1 Tax=Exserohilum turcicum (strain 28A) TaxID=671987 RepID=R0KR73_EXST2|nr:uncharacterized protein SETTUDRAFT_162213 [Exserohilum turcica Et28A]EOA91504.1 hypothetical protein SETTUDRAFT_162213 [Exserohilum turcica Et28A]
MYMYRHARHAMPWHALSWRVVSSQAKSAMSTKQTQKKRTPRSTPDLSSHYTLQLVAVIHQKKKPLSHTLATHIAHHVSTYLLHTTPCSQHRQKPPM